MHDGLAVTSECIGVCTLVYKECRLPLLVVEGIHFVFMRIKMLTMYGIVDPKLCGQWRVDSSSMSDCFVTLHVWSVRSVVLDSNCVQLYLEKMGQSAMHRSGRR